MYYIIERILMWVCGFADLIDGIICIITLAFFRTRLKIKATATLARYRFKNK